MVISGNALNATSEGIISIAANGHSSVIPYVSAGYVLTDNGPGTTATFQAPAFGAPPSSNTATANFGFITAGVVSQNTLGYPVLLNICVTFSGSSGDLHLGVGPTSPPTTDTIINAPLQTNQSLVFCAIVPINYYVLVTISGSLTTQINTQVCPI